MKRLKTIDVLARCKGFSVAIYHDNYHYRPSKGLGFVGNVEKVPVSEIYATYVLSIEHMAKEMLAFHVMGGKWEPNDD